MAQSAGAAGHVLRALLLALACHNAYEIRMHAVRTYGPVIHATAAFWSTASLFFQRVLS